MQQRVAIVTGGADGFGAAIADRFSNEGCRVIMLDLNKQKGEEKAASDPNLHFLLGDVIRQETWDQALAVARERFGRLDVVVNNAGITGSQSLVHTKDMLEYERTFDVNVRPIFCSAQAIVPFMMEQGHGVFVNITR
ncbi:putative secondary metabolism biosynthetic enzyme [Aspergillus puulaauensis]|uniref:Putative secondary metabolism biosynthetic enzyme n=1 Tax=Aspergillus puulaauensis TaxID=1220207 RepID=A0A7R7XIA0_9EURO|nr:putative secondary metabolism biosynthetic enzyme [Aspergillus puulaauensis]BCS21827.1 putative secondary metabolism biosynthetic enzyme [Aspergillus puulaauensis]